MKNRKRLIALLLSLALAASLCACGSEQADSSESPSADISLEPDAEPSVEVDLTQDAVAFSSGLSGDDILLTVNGEDIPADLFLQLLYSNCDWYIYQYYYTYWTIPDSLDPIAEALLDDTVDMAVHYTIWKQRAAELGCLPTDAQMQEAKDKLLANGQDYYDSIKAAYGLSDGSFDFLSTISYYYDNLLDAMVPAVTDEMLNGYVYQVKHILLMTVERVRQDDGTYAYVALPDETVAEKRQQAEDILAQLQAAEGAERLTLFDELMNQYSEDSGLAYYPDGYVYTVEDSLVDGFTEAALALEAGGMSGIVETGYGYHIMLRGEVADLESYADDCRAYQMEQELSALIETAKITRTPALDALDVTAFYDRYSAYVSAVMEQYYAAESEAPVYGDAVG